MSAPIRVLHVINACADGSISRIIERIMGFSAGKEFEWHVAAVKEMGAFTSNFISAGATVVDCSPKLNNPLSSRQKIKRYVDRHQIQIVHSHTPRTILEVWGGLSLTHPLSHPAPIHLATKHLLTSPRDRRWGLIFSLVDRLTLYPPDHLVTVSRTMADEVSSQLGIPPSKVTAIPNAIPVEKYYRPAEREAARRELGLSPETLAIGFTGRISKVKNLDLFLEAFRMMFAENPSMHLVLAGEGDLRPALEAQAKRLGIDRAVSWVGFCSNIPRFLSAVDIYVQPSANEGLSLSILEAMAAEKPVIATRVGSAEEIIKDGTTGILIEPGEAPSIAAALKILTANVELRNCISQRAREFVTKEYNIQKMVDGYYQIYRSLEKKRKQYE
jgi:glycosyltransferase involved in cell wall biosynthesis